MANLTATNPSCPASAATVESSAAVCWSSLPIMAGTSPLQLLPPASIAWNHTGPAHQPAGLSLAEAAAAGPGTAGPAAPPGAAVQARRRPAAPAPLSSAAIKEANCSCTARDAATTPTPFEEPQRRETVELRRVREGEQPASGDAEVAELARCEIELAEIASGDASPVRGETETRASPKSSRASSQVAVPNSRRASLPSAWSDSRGASLQTAMPSLPSLEMATPGY